ncbi:MAG: hypothetical protein V1676_07620 [Candidatus Diapherotrites archaeon]
MLGKNRPREHSPYSSAEWIRNMNNLPNLKVWKRHKGLFLPKTGKKYAYFKPSVQWADLNLGELPLDAKTRILQIGAGSGRLAAWLFGMKKLRPENYDLMDLAYSPKGGKWDGSGVYFKSRIANLLRAGKIRIMRGNMYSYKFSKEAHGRYDHILLPNAFFSSRVNLNAKGLQTMHAALGKISPSSQLGKELARHPHLIPTIAKNICALARLVGNLQVALKPGGTIRISSVGNNIFSAINELPHKERLFPGFSDFEQGLNGNAIIFRKKPAARGKTNK